jgi:hypothetical protein
VDDVRAEDVILGEALDRDDGGHAVP